MPDFDPVAMLQNFANSMTRAEFNAWLERRTPSTEIQLVNEETGAVFSYKADAKGVLKKTQVKP